MCLPGIGGFIGFQGAILSGGGMSVEVTPTYVSKTQGSFGPGDISITTAQVTANVTGGVPAYSYSWARTSGSTDIDADSPTAAATTFTGTVPVGAILNATFVCTVTDANGAVVASDEVLVTLHHVDVS